MTITDLQLRLKSRIDESGMRPRRVSVLAGLHPDAIRRILKRGDSPRADHLAAIARVIGASVDELLQSLSNHERAELESRWDLKSVDSDTEPLLLPAPDNPPEYTGDLDASIIQIDKTDYASIPRFDARLSAGPGSLLEHEPEPLGHFLIEAQWLRLVTSAAPKHLAIVQVDGDSMEPTLSSGDWVLVDTTQCRISRQGVFAIRVHDCVWVKRLQPMLGLRLIRIHSDNRAYDREDVEEESVQVIGRVVSIVARKLA